MKKGVVPGTNVPYENWIQGWAVTERVRRHKMLLRKIITIIIVGLALTSGSLLGQTYTVGDTIDNFSLEICSNGDGTWEYHQEGVGNVVWLNLFTSW